METGIDSLLKRISLFLEDGDWAKADEYCEKVLDLDPENAQAYLGKLMAELKVRKREQLKDQALPFDDRNNYQKALRFGDDKLKNELTGTNGSIKARIADEQRREEEAHKEDVYSKAVALMKKDTEEDLNQAAQLFKTITGTKDADQQVIVCRAHIERIRAQKEAERKAAELRAEEERAVANQQKKQKRKIRAFTVLSLIAALCVLFVAAYYVIIPSLRYKKAVSLTDAGQYKEAFTAFEALNGYKDSDIFLKTCWEKLKDHWDIIAVRDPIAAGGNNTVGLKADGSAVVVGANKFVQSDAFSWKGIVAIAAGSSHTVGLKEDGSVVAVGINRDGQCNVFDWKNIVAIAAGRDHTVGLKADGTVVAVGGEGDGQCDVSGWKDIVAIAAGSNHTVGLKADGTVVAVGGEGDGQCDASGWKDIVAVAAGGCYTVGLKVDGTVVAVGFNGYGECDVSDWKDIVAIAAGFHTVGLKEDGSVVAVGLNWDGQCNVSDWKDIVAIAAGDFHTVGMKADGTVMATGDNRYGQCDVSSWMDIRVPGK